MPTPPMLEPITAGVVVYLINRYITSRINFCAPCDYLQEQMFEHDREESDASSTNTAVIDSADSDVSNHNERIIYDSHPYFLTIH